MEAPPEAKTYGYTLQGCSHLSHALAFHLHSSSANLPDGKLTSTQSLLRSPLCSLIDDSIAAKDNGYVSLEVANPESCRVTQMASIDVPLSQMERDKI